MKVIALASGGLDSTAMLAWLKHNNHSVEALFIDYGQLAAKAERGASVKAATQIGIKWHDFKVTIPFGASQLGPNGCPPSMLPSDDPAQVHTIVPMRNTILLSICAAHALAHGAGAVAYGATGSDAAIYPDCRFDFVCRFRDLLRAATEGVVVIMAPWVEMSKAQVVQAVWSLGGEARLAVTDSYSCYRGGGVHCGTCGACSGRKAAFAEAGIQDPTRYQAA